MRRPVLLDLPKGYQTVIDESDLPLVAGLTLYRGTNGYVYFSLWQNGRSIPRTLHGLLMSPQKGMHVDHVNGDKLDNRRDNLRVVTNQRNQINRKKLSLRNSSGVRGVDFAPSLSRRKPWRAQITVDRRNIYLGLFLTKEEATAVRREAELFYFGELCP